MFQRINFIKIIKDHLSTLRRIDRPSKNISAGDFVLFFLAPLVIGGILAYFEVAIENHVTDLITAASIIGGFLFNLLAIIYGLMDKLTAEVNRGPRTDAGQHLNELELKKIFIKQVHVNISFNILISLFLLISLLFYSYLPKADCNIWINFINHFFTTFIYWLLIVFFLTMLMILNRIYILLKKTD